MKTLTSSSPKIILDNYGETSFLSSKGIYLNKPEILFLRSRKLVNARYLQQKAVQPVSVLSSDAQAELKTVAETHIAHESKTVRVKFQLQKECLFGEQFFLVGDDPILSLWDPKSAIPLDWSDEHIWTAELDIPAGKSIQFKFILRESTGDIVWQPGPDRIFQTWETKNAITVCEDWESVECQKITEEDPTADSEMLVADKVTQPEKSLVSNMNNISVNADSIMNSSKISEKPTAVVDENIGYCEEDPVPLLNKNTKVQGEKQISQQEEESAPKKNMRTEEDVMGTYGRVTVLKNLAPENIGHLKDDPVLNASNKMLGENQISQPKEESEADKNKKIDEDVLANNRRSATTKNLASTDVKGNLITTEGNAGVVPGLPSLPMPDEAKIEHEDQKSIPLDASIGINEAMNYNLPEAELKTLAETHIAYESKTVRVKFQLQKECLFGEQFFLVGDDPILGLWDPKSAIPLDWSDEHIWTAELDIPAGKSIQFKFILRESTGDIVWQPGPDRIFQTWETKNAITVCKDWGSVEYQKITEEDPTANSEMLVADTVTQPEKSLVANNVTQPEKSLVSNMSNISVTADSNMNSSKNPEKREAVVDENIGYCEEDPVPVLNKNTKVQGEKQISQHEEESVPNKNMRMEEDVLGNYGRATVLKNLATENIGHLKDNPVPNASNKMIGENHISQPKEESEADKNKKTAEDVPANSRRSATKNLASTDVKENLITTEGDAGLVPGLPPLPMPDEAKIEHEDEKSIPLDASVGINEAMNYNLPELDEKQERQNDQHKDKKIVIFNEEEKPKPMTHLAKQEERPDAKPLGSDVVQDEIQWGSRTLRTLVAKFMSAVASW